MAQSKLVRVKDEGTDMVFFVTKFDVEDYELLSQSGWQLSDKLSLMVAVGNRARASMSTFGHPAYDIEERTGTLDYNKTTAGVARVIRDTEFENIPDEILLD